MATTRFDADRYKETTRQQWQSAADAWDRWTPTIQSWLGPATARMLDLTGISPGNRVLDIAAGAGEPAISAAKRVGPTGYVLATDISSNILDYARQAATAQGLTNVETQVMDGEHLELPDASFNAVLSRVGLIYFPDRQRALSEIFRVLVPGGRIGSIVYSTAENNQFFSIPISVIRRRAQLPAPEPGLPGPFSLGSEGVLAEAFRHAGFQDIVVERISAPLRMVSADACVQFEQESFGALHQMMSGLSDQEKADTWGEIAHEMRQFEGSDSFTGPCELLVGVGVKGVG